MLNAESFTVVAWWPHQCQEGLIGDIALQIVAEVQTLLLLLRLLLPLPLLFTSTISSERHNIKTDWSVTLPCNCCSHHALQLSVTIGGEHWAGVKTKSNKWNNYFSLTLTSFWKGALIPKLWSKLYNHYSPHHQCHWRVGLRCLGIWVTLAPIHMLNSSLCPYTTLYI